ncbi:MAG: UDP-N-acetylmuramoyl-L-alanine--D-glutamate ligase [Syntrophomonadaceae bacterium]|nr:UDP-N-acetylmuramoyl-L-alanine--D-glutamate ligase [Syntrophomonadaceae bacterium]
MEIEANKILVIGMGLSGIAAAKALRQRGKQVVLCDAKPLAELGSLVEEMRQMEIEVVTGGYPPVSRENTELVITSPGVPRTVAPLQQAEELDLPIWSELELAYRFSPAPFIGITGTNGKTTTTALLGRILQDAGMPSFVGGNIGIPLVLEVGQLTPQHLVVAEVSSFQLEGIVEFKPRVAAILNITPDHLDRHHTMEEYVEVKARILMNQEAGDFSVLNFDCPLTRSLAGKVRGQLIWFSRREILDEGVYVAAGQVVIKLGGEARPVLPASEIRIRGPHNLENALAAVASAAVLGVPADKLARTLREFPGVVHRLELVEVIDGITFINDSKGTNPDSSIKALESFSQPIILIAGGKNKGSDFSELAARIKEKVRDLVLVGQAAPEIRRAVEEIGYSSVHPAATFEEAVMTAAGLARRGDVVLLSPACASWDMFRNYEERGELFKRIVRSLPGERSGLGVG